MSDLFQSFSREPQSVMDHPLQRHHTPQHADQVRQPMQAAEVSGQAIPWQLISEPGTSGFTPELAHTVQGYTWGAREEGGEKK